MKTQSTKTLLERALELKHFRKHDLEITDEDIEVAIAFLEDKITLSQAAKAWNQAKGLTSGAHWLLRCLRRAASQGKLVIKR